MMQNNNSSKQNTMNMEMKRPLSFSVRFQGILKHKKRQPSDHMQKISNQDNDGRLCGWEKHPEWWCEWGSSTRMNFSRLLIPVTGHHRPKYKPVKFCKSICEIYSVYALSCLSLTQSGTNNWFTISLFPQTHIGKFCSTSFLGALFSVAVFLYSTVKSISCYVCSIKMTFYFLYCIQCFKVFPDLFLKQKVGSCDADTLNFSYTSIPSCDLGLNS